MNNGDVYAVKPSCFFTTGSQLGENVTHWQMSAVVGGGPSDGGVATYFDSLLSGPYAAMLNNLADYIGTNVQRVFPGPLPVSYQSVLHAAPGTVAGDILPTQVSGLVTFKTALAGRSGRGRLYIPFPGAGSSTGGNPTGAYVVLLDALAAILLAPQTIVVGAASCVATFGVFNRKSHAFTPVIQVGGESSWATQRRRGDDGRKNTRPF